MSSLAERNVREKSRELIRSRTVFDTVEHLFIRGALTEEIVLITGLGRKQVQNAIHRKRPSTKTHKVDEKFFAPERVTERRRMSHKGKRKHLIDRSPMSQEETNRIEFAKELIEQGFITEDLDSWNQLEDIYAASQRSLPDNFYDQLRLESLVVALSDLNRRRNDSELLREYYAIDRRIDSNCLSLSLKEEELYIADELYLLALYEARKLWSETGDKHLIEDFPKFYIQQDPTRVRRLDRRIQLIQEATPIDNHVVVSENAFIEHADV